MTRLGRSQMDISAKQVDAYLGRLGVRAPVSPTVDTLAQLHERHLRTVPFENSSVRFREIIELDSDVLVDRIARQGRGGFCYELNGAFGALLEAIGYRVERLAARSYEDGGRLGPPFDHLTLRVDADGSWLVDVGFGYSFVHPLRFEAALEQVDPMGQFRLVATPDGRGHDVEWQHRDGAWRRHFRVDDGDHPLRDFEPTCWYHRTSPASAFPRQWLCARALDDGYATLSGRHLVVTAAGERQERDLTTNEELAAELGRWFGVEAPPGFSPDPPPPVLA